MIIKNIHLFNFRNHADSDLSFGEGINVLSGANGQGKTNILEAVSYLGLTKSFYAATDLHVVRLGEKSFNVLGHLTSDGGVPHTVHVAFRKDEPQKSVLIDNVAPESLSRVIGRFPVVILSPEHSRITGGGPAERRRFLDLLLSQVSARYLDDIMQYRRVLRQRNRILHDARWRPAGAKELVEPWTRNLIDLGARIVGRRLQFVAEFSDYVRRTYAFLAGEFEEPSIDYQGFDDFAGSPSEEAIASRMAEELEQRWDEEVRRGVSLVGPHRDELRLLLNGISVQEYASTGQQKTFLVALKVAEHTYLRERRNERPIMLLDDLFGELDEQRSRRILEQIAREGQCVITATDDRPFMTKGAWNTSLKRFVIDRGTVKEEA
ncbi:MAG: DNA replication/repair protein RecF [Bacteroidota bacterium]